MNDNIVLNVDYRENDNEIDSHKVWKLYAEGDPAIRPSPALESKWWDSLTGTDSLGATVPDPNLPLNRRYGTELRPRQSWYIDRFTALKEIIQYSNSIIKSKPLIGSIKFTNLDKADPQPTKDSLEWDGSVETYADLTYVNTKDLSGNVNYLVKADETAAGFWSIYQWDAVAEIWNRTKIQTYKTNDFWYCSVSGSDLRHSRPLIFFFRAQRFVPENEKSFPPTIFQVGHHDLPVGPPRSPALLSPPTGFEPTTFRFVATYRYR